MKKFKDFGTNANANLVLSVLHVPYSLALRALWSLWEGTRPLRYPVAPLASRYPFIRVKLAPLNPTIVCMRRGPLGNDHRCSSEEGTH